MRLNEDGKTVAAMDLLCPGYRKSWIFMAQAPTSLIPGFEELESL